MLSLSNKCGGGGWTLVMKLDGNKVNIIVLDRAETKALIGGGGVYSYIHVLPDEFLLKSVVITVDFKRNSSGRTRIYEYAPPPPPQLTL